MVKTMQGFFCLETFSQFLFFYDILMQVHILKYPSCMQLKAQSDKGERQMN